MTDSRQGAVAGRYPAALPPFEQFVRGLERVVELNRQHAGDGWHIANSIADLLRSSAVVLSREAGAHPSAVQEAVLLLTTHTFNLFVAAVGATVRGELDVVLYLTRPQLDVAALLYASCMHDELAAHYRAGTLRASDARRAVVADLRTAGEGELADEIDRILRGDADAANIAAHAGLVQADRLLETDPDGTVAPVLGGRPAEREVLLQLRAVLLNGMRALWWLQSGRKALLGEEWSARLDELNKRFRGWMAQAATPPRLSPPAS